MIFLLHILDIWHTVDIIAPKDKPKVCERFALTCTAFCEWPGIVVNWVYKDGQTISTTDEIRVDEVSENRGYGWITTKIITLKNPGTYVKTNYKCISSCDIEGLQSTKEKSHLLYVSGTH